MYLQAFLVPFKAPRNQKGEAMDATTDDVPSHYGYEDNDPELVQRVNRCLEELHEEDDEEDEAAEDNVDPELLWEEAAEVEGIEDEMTEELGPMSPRAHQDAMFMLTKVSFPHAL